SRCYLDSGTSSRLKNKTKTCLRITPELLHGTTINNRLAETLRQRRNEAVTMAGIVLAYLSRLGTPMLTHEKVALEAVARAVAEIKHYRFAGWHDSAHRYSDDIYFVPDDTLMLDEAASLGIRSRNDFFGGVVSHPYVKTKAITHQLVSGSADRPSGWSFTFAKRVRDVVLPGYTAFSARDARVAAKRLTPQGPVRLKRALACGSRGQILIATANELDAFLEAFPSDELTEA